MDSSYSTTFHLSLLNNFIFNSFQGRDSLFIIRCDVINSMTMSKPITP